MNSLLNWLDDRVGYRHLMREALDEPIPGGARWRYVWGSTLVFAFFLQVVTGVMLWFSYSPSTRTAWESVYFIQHEMTLGWLIRAVHHFAAQAMIVLLVLHLLQVVVDGAYRAPREVNFWLGLVLMQIIMGLGLTGYLLPWDQKGYYATQVATEIMGATPLVGPYVQKLAQGGAEYGHHTLTRFFALHAGVLPALLIAFLGLHIYVFRRHAIHVKLPKRRPDETFWPDQVLKDSVACLIVFAVVLALAIWKGAELTAPANPAEQYEAARPEWYYLFLFRFLKFEWVSQLGEATGLGEAFGAVLIPGILMGVLILMPLIGRWKIGHRFNVAYLFVVMIGAMTLTGVALYEDWWSPSPEGVAFREAVEQAHIDGDRTVELAQSPSGIPPAGAIELLQNDPLTQGPKIFRVYCADCHQPVAMAGEFQAPPQAPELAALDPREEVSFGTREWMRSILTDFRGHMAALKNISAEHGAKAERIEAAEGILDGDMAYWSEENGPILADEANRESFDALIEFLVAQSGRFKTDADLVAKGRQIYLDGQLANGEIAACADCHNLHVLDEDEPLAEPDYGPTMTNYGGADWLRSFLEAPEDHYTNNNAMPAFGNQLSEREMEMLVRWMAGDYYQAGGDAAPGQAGSEAE